MYWIVRDFFIGDVFFDSTASEFLLPDLARLRNVNISSEHHNSVDNEDNSNQTKSIGSNSGPSVGPGWVNALDDIRTTRGPASCELHVIYGCEVKHVLNDSIQLNNGTIINCDAVVRGLE